MVCNLRLLRSRFSFNPIMHSDITNLTGPPIAPLYMTNSRSLIPCCDLEIRPRNRGLDTDVGYVYQFILFCLKLT
jgi:hypothetical protein